MKNVNAYPMNSSTLCTCCYPPTFTCRSLTPLTSTGHHHCLLMLFSLQVPFYEQFLTVKRVLPRIVHQRRIGRGKGCKDLHLFRGNPQLPGCKYPELIH